MLSIEDFLRFYLFALFFAGDDLPLRRAYHSQGSASARHIVEFALSLCRLNVRRRYLIRGGANCQSVQR
jgi:hypothetical protein